MTEYICILKDDATFTRVTDNENRMWKHVRVVLNTNLRLEAWTQEGSFVIETSKVVKMDLAPAKGDKRFITESGTRYYLK